MTKGRLLFMLLSIACLAPLAWGSLSRAAADDRPGDDSLYKQLSVFSEVLSLVRRNYVEEATVETLMAGALDGTTDALDPLSTFIPPSAVAGYLERRPVGSRHSGLTLAKEGGIAFVAAVADGSPAKAAGIRTGDVISEVDGRSTRRSPLWSLQMLFAGPAESSLEIELMRQGEGHEVTLELAPYEPLAPTLENHGGVPVLRVSELNGGTVEALRELLADPSADSPALLLDLRGVAGVSATVAYRVAELFVSGHLGELKDRKGSRERFDADGEPLWEGELVALIDRGTLGPGEILASVLRQRAGARLVGQRSFGHAGSQTLVSLSSGGRLLITDAFYTGPDGAMLNEALRPDLRVTEADRSFGEREVSLEELTLKRGLELLTGDAAETRRAA